MPVQLEQPTKEKRTKVSADLAQHIRGPALRMRLSGVVLSMDKPKRHHDVIHALADWAGRPIKGEEIEQGFISATGAFWTREHAARMCGREGKLFSEDLW